MNTLINMLQLVCERHRDYAWIAEHIEDLHTALCNGVSNPRQQKDAEQALDAIFPYILMYENTRRWRRLFQNALMNAMNAKDSTAQIDLMQKWGRLSMLSGEFAPARKAMEVSFENADEEFELEKKLLSVIGLIRIQSSQQDDSFTTELVHMALEMAKMLESNPLTAELYQVLAMAYNYRMDTPNALAYGQSAYFHWRELENTQEMARTAFALAQTFHIMRRYEQAHQWLNLSRKLFAQMPFSLRHAALDYQQGAMYLEQKDYDSAVQWLLLAQNEFSQLNQPHYLAATYHALGLTYTHLEQYKDALSSLGEALKIWIEQHNFYEQTNLYFALGNTEMLLGERNNANKYLHLALTLCDDLPDSPSRDSLRVEIRKSLESLQ